MTLKYQDVFWSSFPETFGWPYGRSQTILIWFAISPTNLVYQFTWACQYVMFLNYPFPFMPHLRLAWHKFTITFTAGSCRCQGNDTTTLWIATASRVPCGLWGRILGLWGEAWMWITNHKSRSYKRWWLEKENRTNSPLKNSPKSCRPIHDSWFNNISWSLSQLETIHTYI